MRVCVLGGIGLETGDGRVLPVTSPRPRLILAVLASRAGEVVTDDALAEAIWGDSTPPSVRTALQTYVSALRDVLEPDRPRRSQGRFVARERDGYRLCTDVDELDLARFDALIQRARAVHDNDPALAAELLDEALGVWQAPPFGEFENETWAQGVVARLHDTRASALESRFGMALDDGTASDMIDQIEQAVTEFPFRERLAGQAMLARYRRGEQQRALEIYTETRERLRDELGLEPGRELQLLERAILAHDPALHRGRDGGSRRAATPRPERLVGRESEIAEVAELLLTERCVTLIGPGGVGKTSLAANVVATMTERFGDGVHRVDLADVGGQDVLRGIGGALRVVEHPLAPLADSIADAIGDEPTLLLVETCEVAADDVARAISTLLAAPGLTVLATSQVPLRFQDERVYRVEPLTSEAAVELLERGLPGQPDHDDRRTLEAIAAQVERLPLALELAAGRFDALGLTDVLDRLTRGDELTIPAVDRPERQHSARAAAEWSLGLLDGDQRVLMQRLVTCSAPFTARAATHLWASPPLHEADIGRLLGELVERSLLHRIDTTPTRFGVLDTVRRALLEQTPSGEVCANHGHLVDAVIEVAKAVAFDGDPPLPIAELAGEAVPALDWLDARDDPRQLTLAGLLGTFFIEQGRISEGREKLARAIDANPGAPTLVRALTTAQAGFLAWYQGDHHATRRILGEVTAAVADGELAGLRPTVEGCAAFVEGRYDDAEAALGAAADRVRTPSRQHLLLLHMAGNVAWYAGRLDRAADRYRLQRESADALDDRFHLAQALRFEAMVTAQRGDIESAWRWSERSLAMARASADPVSLAQSSTASAVVALEAGAESDAMQHAVAALRVSRRHFDVFALRTSIPIVAGLIGRSGDAERAARLLGWYLDLLERTGQTPSPAARTFAESTLKSVRDTLGPTGFARASASGAAGRFADVLADAGA